MMRREWFAEAFGVATVCCVFLASALVKLGAPTQPGDFVLSAFGVQRGGLAASAGVAVSCIELCIVVLLGAARTRDVSLISATVWIVAASGVYILGTDLGRTPLPRCPCGLPLPVALGLPQAVAVLTRNGILLGLLGGVSFLRARGSLKRDLATA